MTDDRLSESREGAALQARAPLLSAKTQVALGSVCAVLVAVVGLVGSAHSFWTGQVEQIQAEIRAARREVEILGADLDRRLERIEERSGDRWTLTDQTLWVERLRQRNPTLDVPQPETFRPPARGR